MLPPWQAPFQNFLNFFKFFRFFSRFFSKFQNVFVYLSKLYFCICIWRLNIFFFKSFKSTEEAAETAETAVVGLSVESRSKIWKMGQLQGTKKCVFLDGKGQNWLSNHEQVMIGQHKSIEVVNIHWFCNSSLLLEKKIWHKTTKIPVLRKLTHMHMHMHMHICTEVGQWALLRPLQLLIPPKLGRAFAFFCPAPSLCRDLKSWNKMLQRWARKSFTF